MISSRISLRMLVAHMVFATALCCLQTSVWVMILGQIPGPQLWLCWLVFYALYRPYFESLFVSYFFGLVMTSFTSLSLALIWPVFFALVSLLSFARHRVFWPGLRYYMGAVFISIVCWHVFRFGLSRILDSRPAYLMGAYRLLEVLMTFLVSPVVFIIIKRLEKYRPDEIERGKAQEAQA